MSAGANVQKGFSQTEVLKSCHTLWKDVSEIIEDKADTDNENPFQDTYIPIAKQTIQTIKAKYQSASKEWMYTAVRLLRQMTKLSDGRGGKIGKEILLRRETIGFLLGDLMKLREAKRLEDRTASEICILYHNCFFLDQDKARKYFLTLELWKSVADRMILLDKPLNLEALYGFTRICFVMGAGTAEESSTLRTKFTTHQQFIQFLVQGFNSLVKGDFWLSDMQCRAISDVTKVLLNFTMGTCKEFILHALDKQPFEKETIESVMKCFKTPLAKDPNWTMSKTEDVEGNCLAHVKLELVNLLMHTPKVISIFYGEDPKELAILGELLEFRVRASCSVRELLPCGAAVLCLMEQICVHNEEMARFFKKYIFAEDASNGRKTDKKDLGGLRTKEKDSLRNLLLDLMQSLDVGTKTYAAKFLLATCEGDEKEFIRLTGLGNAIGILQHKLAGLAL